MREGDREEGDETQGKAELRDSRGESTLVERSGGQQRVKTYVQQAAG